ncbi:hypothetical protein D3C84_1142330 [compost metagenome]
MGRLLDIVDATQALQQLAGDFGVIVAHAFFFRVILVIESRQHVEEKVLVCTS